MKMNRLFKIYQNTFRNGMVKPQAVPDSLFDADKSNNAFYKRGREIYTIEKIIQLTK